MSEHTIGSKMSEGSGLFLLGSTIPISTPMRGGVPRRSGMTSEAQDTSPSSLTSMRISSFSCISASVGVAVGSGVTSGFGRATSNVVTTGASAGMASVPLAPLMRAMTFARRKKLALYANTRLPGGR